MREVPSLTLRDDVQIPQLGLGVFRVPPEETSALVTTALGIGYRHIDTAEMYRNEAGVGAGVRASGIAREELFVTSKLHNGAHLPDDARRAVGESLSALGFDYLDLFLIHWPLPTLYGGDFVSTWRALIAFQAEGLIRSIGVSNFQVPHLQRLLDETGVLPSVNQIEANPHFPNGAVRAWGAAHRVLTEAWAPLGQGRLLEEPEVVALATEIGRSSAQVLLRWAVQRGDIVFPKSSHRERLEDNLAIFDFELEPQQIARLDALDRGAAGRHGPDPDTFAPAPRS